MTPKKMFYTTLAGSTLFVVAFVVAFPMYLEHRTYKTDHPVIKIQKPVTFGSFPSENLAKRLELVSTSIGSNGQVQAVAMLTYEDGRREECTFRMALEPVDGGVNVTPQSRICKPTDTTRSQ
ncbi:hypothetical protein HBO07_27140 [Pseudomonas proteolytica]|uniref:hypothetical protein n=1 Tax=Pseudomonas proteolytica TaxID=219574 RepID=UPI00147318FC|nr:hypothetical protein [Pseudomonas proteolytica]NMZ14939.1 hypothetical protein [Pseudomonas proteolytica]